jgi:phosphomannomutase
VGMDVDDILEQVKNKHKHLNPSVIDGVKVDFEDGWVHLRKSNTEPIIRIYSEGKTEILALQLANEIIGQIKEIIG